MLNEKEKKDFKKISKCVFDKIQDLDYDQFEITNHKSNNFYRISLKFVLVEKEITLKVEKPSYTIERYNVVFRCDNLKLYLQTFYEFETDFRKFFKDLFNTFIKSFKKEIQKINDNFNEKYKKYLN